MSDYVLNEIDMEGFQLVRSQYFQKVIEPTLTLWSSALAFGTGAYQALNNCEAVQVMLNDKTKSIVIRPVNSNSPEAVSWRKRKDVAKYSKLECPQLTRKIYEQWGLNRDCHYRTYGRVVQSEQKIMILFEFTSPQVYNGSKRVDENGQ